MDKNHVWVMTGNPWGPFFELSPPLMGDVVSLGFSRFVGWTKRFSFHAGIPPSSPGMKLPLMEITQRALSSSSSVCVMVLRCDDVKGLGATPVLTHISCTLALSEVLQIGEELWKQSKTL